MNTILRPGDKVRVVMDESGHGFPLFSVVILKEKRKQLGCWTVEGSTKLIWENECGNACLRCQPGGSCEHKCTCRVLMCATCTTKARGFLAHCMECGGTLYPEDELLKKLKQTSKTADIADLLNQPIEKLTKLAEGTALNEVARYRALWLAEDLAKLQVKILDFEKRNA